VKDVDANNYYIWWALFLNMRKSDYPVGWDVILKRPEILQLGDIVHIQRDTILSKTIRIFGSARGEGKTWASHSALVLGPKRGVAVIEALTKVKINSLLKYSRQNIRFVIYRMPKGLNENQKKVIREKALEYRGRNYGYFKILAHALDRLLNNKYFFRQLALMDKYPICSWLVAYVYYRSVGLRFDSAPNAAQPDDILDYCVKNNWDLVWADSESSLRELSRIYGGL